MRLDTRGARVFIGPRRNNGSNPLLEYCWQLPSRGKESNEWKNMEYDLVVNNKHLQAGPDDSVDLGDLW